MIKKTIKKLVADISRGQIEIYNEFSLQHEVGLLLRAEYPRDKVQFERNISYFFNRGEFIKKEIDIAVFSPDKSELRYAIELKFPRNGQHPEQMFSFCKDILFAEQLKASGFQRTFLIIFADDKLFFLGMETVFMDTSVSRNNYMVLLITRRAIKMRLSSLKVRIK